MLSLITGTPGSGKSLQAVHRIKLALDEGRAVYTDIDGINLPGVNVVDLEHEWMDTPEGSLVVYDEVQRRWPSTGRPGHADSEDIRALETHRHTGHDIIVITQHPTLVHHHVRKLVGEHVHVRRVSGAKVVTLFSMSEAFDPSDGRSIHNADKATWRYPKELFDAYKSATAHTHKFKIPAKFKFMLVAIVALVALVIYAFSQLDMLPDTDTASPSGQSEAATAAARSLPLSHPDSGALPVQPLANVALVAAASVETLPVIAGGLKTADRCRVWNPEGQPLNTTREQCELLLAEMPSALGAFKSSRSGGGDSDNSEDQSYAYSPPPPPGDKSFQANGALGVY